MGFYLRYLRPGRISEVTAIGVVLLVLAIVGGNYVEQMGLEFITYTLGPLAMRFELAADRDLLLADGLYARMYRQQAAAYT